MALEETMEKLTTAVNALTAAYLAAGGKKTPAETSTKPAATTGTKPATTAKAKHTAEEVQAAAVAVREKVSKEAAQELIKTVGKAAKLAEIDAKNYDAFVAACEAKIAEGECAEPEDDDSL